MGSVQVFEAVGLLAQDAFLKIAVKETIGHVQFMDGPTLGGDQCQDRASCGWFDDW